MKRKERKYSCILKEKNIDVRGFIQAIALCIKNNGIKKRGR